MISRTDKMTWLRLLITVKQCCFIRSKGNRRHCKRRSACQTKPLHTDRWNNQLFWIIEATYSLNQELDQIKVVRNQPGVSFVQMSKHIRLYTYSILTMINWWYWTRKNFQNKSEEICEKQLDYAGIFSHKIHLQMLTHFLNLLPSWQVTGVEEFWQKSFFSTFSLLSE